MARANAELNGLGDVCRYRAADAFDALKELEQTGAEYDMVTLDPPAFAKTKQAVPHALNGYKEINRRAFRLVRSNGYVATCSCSHHVDEQALWGAVQQAAQDARRQLRVLEMRSQARDHPVLAAMPETRYLKCIILQVL